MNDRTVFTNMLTENLVSEITKALALPQTKTIRKIIARLTGKAIRRLRRWRLSWIVSLEQRALPGEHAGSCLAS